MTREKFEIKKCKYDTQYKKSGHTWGRVWMAQ